MSALHYRPASQGAWLAVAAGPRALVLPVVGDDAFVDAALAALSAPRPIQGILDLLTAGGLSATPDFALLEWDPAGLVRLIVRGDLTVTADSADGAVLITGAGVSTWTERALSGVRSLTLEAVGATPLGARDLPLGEGAALVAALSVGVSADAAASPEPVPETTIVQLTAEDVDSEMTVVEAPGTPNDERVASDAEGYDYLFGATMYRSVSDAAIHTAVEEAGEPGPVASPSVASNSIAPDSIAEDTIGDHDGETVMTSDVAKLRGSKRGKRVPTPAAESLATMSLVQANGNRDRLDRKILIGRAPTVTKVSGGDLPRLITLGGGDQDISRNHAQVVLEGDSVVVTDLHSRNGTLVVLPGKSPQKLRAGEPTVVIVGTVIDFGGGITLTVERD